MLKFIGVLAILFSINVNALILTDGQQQNIQSYHQANPNAAIINKLNGMIQSFDSAIDISCREIAYKIRKDTFLVYQSVEYYACMRKAHVAILGYLGYTSEQINEIGNDKLDIKARTEKERVYFYNRNLEVAILNKAKISTDELLLQFELGAAGNYVRFGAYSGSGAEVVSLFNQYRILGVLEGLYYAQANLEVLACGAMFSTCKGKDVSIEALLEMTTLN